MLVKQLSPHHFTWGVTLPGLLLVMHPRFLLHWGPNRRDLEKNVVACKLLIRSGIACPETAIRLGLGWAGFTCSAFNWGERQPPHPQDGHPAHIHLSAPGRAAELGAWASRWLLTGAGVTCTQRSFERWARLHFEPLGSEQALLSEGGHEQRTGRGLRQNAPA